MVALDLASGTAPGAVTAATDPKVHLEHPIIPDNGTSALPANKSVRVDRYVSFAGGFRDGRGLGNQLFDLAAVVYVAELTGRQPAILNMTHTIGLDKAFDLGIERFDDLCPCYYFGEDKSLSYDARLEELVRPNSSTAAAAAGKSIFVSGFFQSWKYTRTIDRRLRGHLKFRTDVQQFADLFLDSNIPPGWIKGFVRVGVHVRRGDILSPDKIEFGYTTPNEKYFQRAARYFVELYGRVQFVVCSNDMKWTKKYLTPLTNITVVKDGTVVAVNVTFVEGTTAGQDMAVLASCDHTIMSSGTFSWWAAWLAKGTTIYYGDWPRKGSSISRMFKREDYFPPSWISMV